jgi:protein-tyrosine-phosphatase
MKQKITIVCTGNTCRSPMAAQILQRMVPNAAVESRGTNPRVGEGISMHAKRVLQERGYSIEHAATAFTLKDLESSDFVLCMEQKHLDRIHKLAGKSSVEKVMILGNGIQDPYGSSFQKYKETFQAIEMAITFWYSEKYYAKEA